MARKHAGGAGEGGFHIALPTLFEKSGAEGQYRRFKFEVAAIVRQNALPGYDLALVDAVSASEPLLHMVRRGERAQVQTSRRPAARTEARPAASPGNRKAVAAPEETRGYLTDETLAHLRANYRGWDFHALHAEFKAWVHADEQRAPDRYQSAFIGFVRRYHEKNRHQLTGA